MVTVYFSNETSKDTSVYESVLEKLIDECLVKVTKINAQTKEMKTHHESRAKPYLELSITFTNDSAIRELNHRFRQIDKYTDVLSFPMFDSWHEWPIGEQTVAIGDIVLSLERAELQSKEYGHSLMRELGFLTVHSMLHLMGFDHVVPEKEEEMCGLQEEILWGVGLSR